MANVDQRVVQMVFDKGNFESAVQSVIKTLDNLKKNLNLDKASSEFNKISVASKDVDMSSLANSVDIISSRFTNMGIIGMSVLNNLTNTAVNAGKTLLNAITSPIIQGGKTRALNLEAAKFQIEGLGFTWEQVYDDIDYAVTGTAYGLDAAAKAAGQLLASSVQIGPEMKNALRGISGVAAMTSSEYEDIAQVFTTVAGNGRLMASELNRLSARGINAAATLGQYLGKSEAEVRDMVSKGQIDFNTFAAAMDDAFGEHAKDANKTFTGALSNMKAALARIGAEFATPAYQHMRDVLNSLRLVANEVKTLIAPLVTSATQGMTVVANYLTWAFEKITNILSSDGAKGAMEQINRIIVAIGTSLWNLYRAVRNILRPIAEAFAQAFGGTLLDILARAAEGIEQFTRSLAINARMQENLRKTFVGVFTILASVLNIVGTLVGTIAGVFSTVIVNVFGFFVDVLLNITAFLSDVVLKVKEFFEWVLKLEIVQTILQAIGNAFETIGKFVGNAFENFRNFVNMLLDNAFSGALGIFNSMGEAVQKLAEWIKIAWQHLTDWINKVKELPIVKGTFDRINDTLKNLGEHISNISSKIKSAFMSAFEKAREVVSKFINILKELFGETVKLPNMQEAIANFQQFVVDAFNNSKDIFEFIKEVVTGVIDRIKELTSTNFQKVLDNFARLRDRIREVIGEINNLEDVKRAITNVGNFFAGFSETTSNFIEQVKSNLSAFVEWVKTKISGITLGEIIAAGSAASFMAFFFSLASFLNKAKKIVIDFATFSTEFAKIPKTINKTIKSWGRDATYDKVKERINAIAGLVNSLALLAGALMLLSNIDPIRLVTSAAVLGGLLTLVAVIAGFMAANPAINGKNAKNSLGDLGIMMMELAGSLIILAAALKIVSGIKTEDLAKGVIALGVALGALVTGAVVISKNAKEATVGATTILALAGAMLMLSGAIAMLSIIPAANLAKAVTAIGILMLVTSLAARLASTGNKASFGTIMGLALSMIAMIGALKLAASLSTADFISGLLRIVAAVGVVALLSKAISKAGPDAAGAGIAIGLISASFILLAAAFKVLATINDSDVAKGLTVLTGVTVIFAMMAGITRLAGRNGKSAGTAIMLMSGSLILIAAAIGILAQIDPGGLARATLAVDSLIAMFALLVAATSMATSATKTIGVMAISIAALAGAIAVLSLIEPANLMSATLAIDSLILSFAVLTAASGLARGAYGAIILMTSVVVVFGMMLEKLAAINPEGQLQVALGLSALISALSVAMLACAAAGAIGPAAFIGIGVMAGVFAAIVALISIIGAINAATDGAFRTFLEDTIPVLQAIGEGIGAFFGSIAGGFLSSAASGIETFGNSLNSFMDSFLPFVEGMKTVDESALKGVNTLVSMVLALAAADFANAITNILGGSAGSSMSMLSEQLPQFGEALQKFSQSLGNTDTGSLEKAAQAGKALGEMAAALPKEGGWMENIFGKSDMSGFGENLVEFGGALKKLGDVANGINVEAINGVIEPTRSLVELGNMIPETGGFIQVFTGSKDMGDFGENLVTYGESLKKFGEVLGQGINYNAISQVMQPTKDLIELAKSIEAIGGLGDAITGADDLGSFGANLATFGGTFQLFSDKISGIDQSAFDIMPKVIEAVRGLAEVSKSLPELGGLGSFFTGDQSLAEFGIQLPNLAYGLKTFATEMNGVEPSVITNSVPAIQGLVDIANSLKETGGLWGMVTGTATKIKDFGEQLAPLGAGLLTYSSYVRGIDVGAIQNSVPAVIAMSSAAEHIPGLIETITRIPGILGFPVMATSLGQGIHNFSSNLSGVDIAAAQQGAQTAEALAQAAKSMPGFFDALSTWLAELMGNSFSESCSKLAEGIKAFSEGLNGVSVTNIQNGVQALDSIRGISENSGNFANLKTVGETIKSFGESFKAFYDKMTSGIDFGAIDTTIEYIGKIATALSDFQQSVGEGLGETGTKLVESANTMISGLRTAFEEGQQSIHDAAYNLVNQINNGAEEALGSTYEKFAAIGQTIISALTNAISGGGDQVGQSVLFVMQWALDTINGKQGEFQSAGEALINQLASGMTSAGPNVVSAGETIVNDTETKIRSHEPTFQDLGKKLMDALARGIRNMASTVKSAVQNVVDSATKNISTSAFYNIGQNCGDALARGLRSKRDAVQQAADELARAAQAAVEAAAQIKSPSRVFLRLGAYMSEGLANGLVSHNSLIEKRAKKAVKTAFDAMSVVADAVEKSVEDIEYSPKITPVLDSSSLVNGIQGVNSIFGTSYGTNLANRAFGQLNANSLHALRNQNGMKELEQMLDSKFDKLVYAVSGIQINPITDVYLDGKQLANGLSRPMNRALGSISKRGGIT